MKETRTLDRQGVRQIAASVLALGLVGALVAWQQLRTPVLDPVTLRAAGQPVRGEVAILLDVTDPLTPSQVAAATEWLRQLELVELLPNEHLTVWALGTWESGGLERVFTRYYPGRESDPILHNPSGSAASCDSLFSRPLRAAVQRAATGRHYPRSPILEAIQEIARQPEFADARIPRHLVVVSDLLQHTPALSFYRRVPSFQAFHQTPQFAALRAELRGVAVDLLYLPRSEVGGAGARLIEFWREYVVACGSRSVRVRRV